MEVVRFLPTSENRFVLTLNRIFYVQIINNAALILVFYLILRETRGDVVLKKAPKSFATKLAAIFMPRPI